MLGYPSTTRNWVRHQRQQTFHHGWDLPIAPYPTKLAIGEQQPGTDPALGLIARPPALHIAAHRLHHRESRLDQVRARQRSPQSLRDAQPMHGERLSQTLFPTARGT